MVKSAPRRGDAANMCILELVGRSVGGGEVTPEGSEKSGEEAVSREEKAADEEVATETVEEEEGKK